MRIIFIGNVQLSAKVLVELIDMQQSPVGICVNLKTHKNSDFQDLSLIANANAIPFLDTADINNSEALTWVQKLQPDVIFCVGWSQILAKPLLEIPRLGVIGYHPSALPQNRGRHPLIWAIALGLEETGSTFFMMDSGIDSGDIISQRTVEILPSDYAADLYKRVTETAVTQLKKLVHELRNGQVKRLKQNQLKANHWRSRSFKDGLIDWRMSARSINNLVRALSRPYPGAHFQKNDRLIKVWKSEVVTYLTENIEPGRVIKSTKEGALIKTGEQGILLKEIEPKIKLNDGICL